MKMLLLVTILVTLSGVLTQSSNIGVNYPALVCAANGFNVFIPCYYYYPETNHVTQKLWCSMNANPGWCTDPPYVYDSSLNTTSNFVYVGNDKSDCTLLINNVRFNYSGEYRFRFLTNVRADRFTGVPGVILQVADLKVSLIRLSGNGTLKVGDSLNLTCDVNCTHSSSQFVWSKNNVQLNTPGPVLHFPALTVSDSGSYTCTWENNVTSGSKTISLQVEAGENTDRWPVWVIAVVISGVSFIILAISAAVIYSTRRKHDAPEDSGKVGEQTKGKQVPQPNEEVSQQGEVTYASVFVKDNNLNNGRVQNDQKKEDISVIYSDVKIK